jgi:hypothetical protein
MKTMKESSLSSTERFENHLHCNTQAQLLVAVVDCTDEQQAGCLDTSNALGSLARSATRTRLGRLLRVWLSE